MTSLPDRQRTVDLVSEAQSDGARLENACELLNISVRTYQRWYRDGKVEADNRPIAIRPEPSNKLTPEEQSTVLTVCNEPEYRSCPPGFIVADLLDQGRYLASESTIYRLLRAADQQHHRGREKAPTPTRQATSHKAQAPNQLWSWDISWLPGPIKGQWFYLYLMVDLFSRKIVAHEVYESETGELASEFVQKAYWRERLAAQPRPLVLHSDNGSPMKAAIFQEKLYDLGIVPSRSRPRVSNDNAFSEALFRTLKYRPGFPAKGFATLEQARQWVLQFTHWYNHEHRHSALNYVTPAQRHNGKAQSVLASRQRVLTKAKSTNPERWSGAIRDLSLPETVTLNPEPAANC
jgi:transposase InsO family protein